MNSRDHVWLCGTFVCVEAIVIPLLKDKEGGATELAVFVIGQLLDIGPAALESGEPRVVFQDGGEEPYSHVRSIIGARVASIP